AQPIDVNAPVQRQSVDTVGRAAEPASFDSPAGAAQAAPAIAGVTAAFVPAAFDSESFARIAKMIFIRMQTANDAADLNDLRRFTTPEMFAAVRLELQDRGSKVQTTDVLMVDAEVLDVAEEADRQVVSVRFRGEVVEEAGAAPTAFDEVWHLVKAAGSDNNAWAIAGIEQMAH
ncbi:MAG: Tim44 domain-containing protein, partial [Chitinophagaceae bacterium]|nr:Tim44 domain-containing protein [Rubrivivax sp.]